MKYRNLRISQRDQSSGLGGSPEARSHAHTDDPIAGGEVDVNGGYRLHNGRIRSESRPVLLNAAPHFRELTAMTPIRIGAYLHK